jgi:hypothetical protein
MRLELASSIPDAVTVLVDANEIAVESGKRINYPFKLGVIRRLKNGRFRSQVWTPAAPLPRGYPAAARATLATLIQELEAGVRQWPGARDTGPQEQPARGDMNFEGLTFPEWMAAAGVPLPAPIDVNREQIRELARAWQDGEDPTEHRAARATARSSAPRTTADRYTRGHHDAVSGKPSADLGSEYARGYQEGLATVEAAAGAPMNPAGVTWKDWAGLAGVRVRNPDPAAAQAYKRGVDPLDWKRSARATARGSKPGYTSCACRDCMEVAIGVPGAALCSDCEQAGCSLGDRECQSPHSYGG